MLTNTRRDFIKNSALCAALFGMPALASAAPAAKAAPAKGASAPFAGPIEVTKGVTILFQGDSITEDGRQKSGPNVSRPNHPRALGSGYAFLAAAAILNKHAGKEVKIFNRGISGNKVPDLINRWEKDTLAFSPDILSIMIGVNDYWHTLNKDPYKGTLESYEADYRALLKQTREKLPKTRIVLCEPFALDVGTTVKKSWFPTFDGYRAAARKLAEEFGLTFVPFQTVFNDACKRAPGRYWSEDGIHTTTAGRQLMAEAWLAAALK